MALPAAAHYWIPVGRRLPIWRTVEVDGQRVWYLDRFDRSEVTRAEAEQLYAEDHAE